MASKKRGTKSKARRLQKHMKKTNHVMTQKYSRGEAVKFMSRSRAIRKLQISLRQFRQLCILKGIYPVQPNNELQASRGMRIRSTFYLVKDIKFLAREQLIEKFAQQKVQLRKIRKAKALFDFPRLRSLKQQFPDYTLDHIVFERYPTFDMALNDLDDALCTIFLFAAYPPNREVPIHLIQMCRRLAAEWFNYCIYAQCLKKVFISIKGYYYQAEVQGHQITWLQPHQFTQSIPKMVDFKVLKNFLDIYVYLLGFVNFRLFQSINLVYPPKLAGAGDKFVDSDYLTAFSAHLCKLSNTDENEDVELDSFEETNEAMKKQNAELEADKTFKNLFKGLRFFVSREVPREQFAFVIRSFGGEVSWGESQGSGATFGEQDSTITHQIVDRPIVENRLVTRFYILPQWVFDCVNAQKLLPMEPYFPGNVLPPHVSPFVTEESESSSFIPAGSKSAARKQAEEDMHMRSDDEVSDGEEFLDEEIPISESDVKSEKENKKGGKAVTPGKKVANKKVDFPEQRDEEMLAKQLPKSRKFYYNAAKKKEQKEEDRANNLAMKRKMAQDVERKNKKALMRKMNQNTPAHTK